MLLNVHTFSAPLPGPHLLLLGGIHGNEPCGTVAITQLIEDLHSGAITLTHGTLTCLPLCNPQAKAHNVRYVTHNLNRIMHPHPAPTCLEESFADTISLYITQCDVLLDLHSFHTPGVPFMFCDYTDAATLALTAALGVPYVITGWPELYQTHDALSQGDTVGYAHSQGKTAALVECGNHNDPASTALATQCLARTLQHLGMTEAPLPPLNTATITVRMTQVFVKPEGGTLARQWQNMDRFSGGDTLAFVPNSGPLKATHDGYMIMPFHDAKPGDEWFYTGMPA